MHSLEGSKCFGFPPNAPALQPSAFAAMTKKLTDKQRQNRAQAAFELYCEREEEREKQQALIKMKKKDVKAARKECRYAEDKVETPYNKT